MNTPTSQDRTQALFHELFASATQSASQSLHNWTSGEISLSLEEVKELPLEEVSGQLPDGDDMLTIIVLTLEGELGGQIILTFDNENGREMAAMLLNRAPSEGDEWTPLEVSALKETGNILACAYVHSISDLINRNLVPSPPHFVQDFGSSVLQQAVMAQAMVCDRILVCSTSFRRNETELNWRVFFVPDGNLLSEIHSTLESAV